MLCKNTSIISRSDPDLCLHQWLWCYLGQNWCRESELTLENPESCISAVPSARSYRMAQSQKRDATDPDPNSGANYTTLSQNLRLKYFSCVLDIIKCWFLFFILNKSEKSMTWFKLQNRQTKLISACDSHSIIMTYWLHKEMLKKYSKNFNILIILLQCFLQ